MKLSSRYKEALVYALDKHEGQTRKGTDIPYASHLLAVSALVVEAGGDEDMAIAGLLHDAPEDQGGQSTLDEIRKIFGERVAHMVEGCTDSLSEDPANKEDWLLRKTRYLEHLKTADEDTLTVSLADKVHNARAIAMDLQIVGDAVWDRFKANKEQIIWYYSEIEKTVEQRAVNPYLEHALASALSALKTHQRRQMAYAQIDERSSRKL
jgi:(p)ppGpp synthase/HD superfamily hydrolase